MKTYAKGARFERELLQFLSYKGFSCIRGASSGGYFSPVDIVAIKKGLVLGIECKSWSKKPRLEKKKLLKLKEWCQRAGALGVLAWKSGPKWLFLGIDDAEKGNYEDDNWIELDRFLDAVDFR